VLAVLADQRDFFFFLFIFIKYTDNSLGVITTLGINLRKGLCRYCGGQISPGSTRRIKDLTKGPKAP
jgi:hypothetical protein